MAKNRSKKKKNSAVPMDSTEPTVSDIPQAMDTSETGDPKPNSSGNIGQVKKGRPMKRSRNVRRMKAREKAISANEKAVEKVLKCESKTVRTKSAKQLYD